MSALLALALLASPEPGLLDSLQRARARPEARLEITRLPRPADCQAQSWVALRPIEASGPVSLRIEGRDRRGRPCLALEQVGVRLFAPTAVTPRAVAIGERIEPAIEEREVLAGRSCLASVEEVARARRPLRAGDCLTPTALQFGPAPGSAVEIELQRGPLTIAQQGRAVDCGGRGGCAELPGGRRVTGHWNAGVMQVEQP